MLYRFDLGVGIVATKYISNLTLCAQSTLLQSDNINVHPHAIHHLARVLLEPDYSCYVDHERNHVVDFLANRVHSLSVSFHCIELIGFQTKPTLG
ncbi:hypothetical protein LINPERPRIM_LOCUS7958 [Linum perenne]